MSRRSLFLPVLAILALAGASVAAEPLLGPPWISIEYPPSPYDRTTRDAYLLVHAFHHGTPAEFPVSGSAEGIVSGERRSVKLAFASTSRPGTFALRKQWSDEGIWTLVISVGGDHDNQATAVVEIGGDGQVASVRVPTERRSGWEVSAPRKVTMREVETALRARAQGSVARRP
jgi:hypothetical protein